MPYVVKEIFYTLQGEGAQSGRAAVFLRFTGCNLWTGREQDRGRGAGGCSAWCDTDFVGIGPDGGRFATAKDLAATVKSRWLPNDSRRPMVVCTGGEPLLQLDEPLIEALHVCGFEVAVETNGTQERPAGIDWLCVSPKANAAIHVTNGDELKLVYPQVGAEPERYEHLAFSKFFLQPRDSAELEQNIQMATAYCLAHPQWQLSIQMHKLVGLR